MSINKGLVFFLSFFFLINPTIIHGQNTVPIDLYFQSLKAEQGLPGSVSPYIYRDSRDYVWIGSTEGLTRFDGQTCRNYQYTPKSASSLADNNIQSDFFEDKKGDLWFATYTALNHYSRADDKIEFFRFKDSLQSEISVDYRVIDRFKNRFLWVRAGDVMYEFDIQTKKQNRYLNPFIGIRSVSTNSPNKEKKRIFSANWFVGKGFDLHEYTPDGKFIQSRRHIVSPTAIINHLQIENDSLLWLSDQTTGVLLYNINTKKIEASTEQDNQYFTPMYIQPFSNHYLLVATRGNGLILLDKKNLQIIKSWSQQPNKIGALNSSNIYSLYIDNKAHLWVCNEAKGINFTFLNQIKFQTIYNNVESPLIFQNNRGKTFLVHNKQNVFRYDEELNRGIEVLTKSQIISVYEDRSETLWLLTRPGIYRIQDGREHFFPNPPNAGYPRQLSELTNGKIIIAYFYGVYQVEGLKMKPIPGIDKNTSSPNIYVDQHDLIYLNHNSSELHVYKHENNTFSLRQKHDLGIRINCYYEDTRNDLLLLGTSKGLYKINGLKNKKPVITVSTTNNYSINGVIQDDEFNTWMTSSRGLFCINPKSIRVFTTLDGLTSNDCKNVVKLKSGNFLISSSDGLNLVNPKSLILPSSSPPIAVNNFSINHKKQQTHNKVNFKLRYWQNTISIDFISLDYLPNTKYLYKLNGFEERWVETKNGFAHYPSLPSGKYQFIVRSSDINELWGKQHKILKLTILPPFWQTWWFISICLAFLLAIIYTIYQYRIKQIKKELLFKQKVIESEMKALRAQMNPHFIFNSLNSINAFILAHQTTLATEYLTQFANLIRQILDYSAKDIISLEHEIEFLGNYLQIESIRMQNKLSYSIDISPEIDTFETEIPSLVLQPYIENAIWHGISKRPEGGTVIISIHRNSQTLTLTVEDNGVGRTHSQQQVKKQHESKGLHITAERLALYAEKYQKQVEVQILDLFDGNVPAGTKVNISISSG